MVTLHSMVSQKQQIQHSSLVWRQICEHTQKQKSTLKNMINIWYLPQQMGNVYLICYICILPCPAWSRRSSRSSTRRSCCAAQAPPNTGGGEGIRHRIRRLRALPFFLLQLCLRVGVSRCGPAAVVGGVLGVSQG